MQSEDAGPRCFIGFYGMNRSLRWTAPSIRRNIFAPMKAAGFECFLAGHFNQPGVIHNAHSGERGVTAPKGVGSGLRLDLQWIEPQCRTNIAELLDTVLQVPFRDGEDPTGDIRRNVLNQLHSLRRLGAMIDMVGPERFDAFLFLRPDIEYIDPIDLAAVEAVVRGDADLVTPAWHQWGGLNDRFAFANRKAADVFLGRWERVPGHCRARGYLHPETLLAEAVAEAGLKVRMTEQRALRVRANGDTHGEGFRLPLRSRLTYRARSLLAGLLPPG